jgi:hypothetical protein
VAKRKRKRIAGLKQVTRVHEMYASLLQATGLLVAAAYCYFHQDKNAHLVHTKEQARAVTFTGWKCKNLFLFLFCVVVAIYRLGSEPHFISIAHGKYYRRDEHDAV